MAKAKAKPRGANRYTPPKKSSAPSWIWLIAGMLIGGFVMFLMKLDPKQEIRNRPVAGNNSSGTKTTTPNGKKPTIEFDYRDMLQGKSPQTLTEEQRKALEDGKRAADILAGKTPTTPPVAAAQPTPTAPTQPPQTQKPVTPVVIDNTTQAPVVTNTNTPPTNVTNTSVATAPPATPSTLTATRFFLQVGSYPNKNSAESIRAQLLMMGKDVRIEQTQTNNKQWFRVLVGPYSNRDTAVKNQQQLASSGFNGTIIIPRKIQ